jgi:hypothetical protein
MATPLFYNEYFTPHIPRIPGVRGGDSFRFPVAVTGNGSAATFTEGAALPVSGQVTWVQASAAWTYFRSVVKLTGHSEDSAQGTDNGPQQQDYEFTNGTLALKDLVNTTLLADAATGLLGIVDDDTTAYYGLSRATYTGLQAYVSAVGGALTLAEMLNMYEGVRDNDRGGLPKIVFSGFNQITNYYSLGAAVGANNVSARDVGQPSGVDYGYRESAVSFCGVPWVGIPDFVDTEIVMLDTAPGNWGLAVHREFRVDEMAKEDDSRTFQLSYACALICPQPQKQGKLETVNA